MTVEHEGGIEQQQDGRVNCRLCVYRSPQPAAWVGLTDEEHYALVDKAGCMSADWVDYAKSIEQALKEKNT